MGGGGGGEGTAYASGGTKLPEYCFLHVNGKNFVMNFTGLNSYLLFLFYLVSSIHLIVIS